MPSASRSASRFAKSRQRAIRGHMVVDDATAQRLRRLRLRRLGIVLGAACVIGLAVGLYFSPLLRVQHIDVVGAKQVDSSQVEQLASLGGHSMLRLDTASAQERIRFLPMVRSVQIERHWPQTVRVIVTERLPWGYWQVGDARYVVDNEGVVLAPAALPDGSPVIKDLSNPVRLVPGDHVDLDAVTLTQSLVTQVPGTLAENIAGVEYSNEKGLSLLTNAGYRVVFGDSQNVDYKLAVWKGIEGQLGRDHMSGHVLDLRFEERPSFQ